MELLSQIWYFYPRNLLVCKHIDRRVTRAHRTPNNDETSTETYLERLLRFLWSTANIDSRPNLSRVLGWSVFDERLHASWVRVATADVACTGSSTLFPASNASRRGLDVSEDVTMAKSIIEMTSLWDCGSSRICVLMEIYALSRRV